MCEPVLQKNDKLSPIGRPGRPSICAEAESYHSGKDRVGGPSWLDLVRGKVSFAEGGHCDSWSKSLSNDKSVQIITNRN